MVIVNNSILYDMIINSYWQILLVAIVACASSLLPVPARAECTLAGTAVCDGVACAGEIRPTGHILYNQDFDVSQVCRSDGTWQAISRINCPAGDGCGSGGDATPDAFSFTDQSGVGTSTVIESNTINITGIDTATNVSISGDGSPEFRIAGGSWVTSGTITNGQSLQLRLTSNAASSTTNSATVTVGTESDQWDVTTGGADPCAGSPSPGDVCTDGSVYAGLSPDGNVPMYTTPADESSSAYWGTYNFTTGSTSYVTGRVNSADVYAHVQAGDGSYNPDDGYTPNASVLCEELSAHGHTDWYLPARDELNVLYTNRAAIGGFDVSGSLPAGFYWSSSADTSNGAQSQRFSDGFQTDSGKYLELSVRCVRR